MLDILAPGSAIVRICINPGLSPPRASDIRRSHVSLLPEPSAEDRNSPNNNVFFEYWARYRARTRKMNVHTFQRIKNKPHQGASFSVGRSEPIKGITQPQQPSAQVNSPASEIVSPTPASRFTFDFTKIPLHPPAPPISLRSYQRAKRSAKSPGQSKSIEVQAPTAHEPDEEAATSVLSSSSAAPISSAKAGHRAGQSPSEPVWVSGRHVVPDLVLKKSVSSKRSDEMPSTTVPLRPTFHGEAAVDHNANVWRYQLGSVESKVIMTIVYYPKEHYPAPTPNDDSGALKNITKDNWKTAVKELDEHKAYIFDFWASYQAEDVHEDYHWTSWQDAVKKELPFIESELEGLQVNFDQAPTAAKATKILKPAVKEMSENLELRARRDMDAIGDEVGDPPYNAQVPVVDALIQRIRDYAENNNW